MKFNVTAYALAKACDAYMSNIEFQIGQPQQVTITKGFLWWKKTETKTIQKTPDQIKAFAGMVREYPLAKTLSAIAKYKSPQTILDINSEDIPNIAIWLPEFVSERI